MPLRVCLLAIGLALAGCQREGAEPAAPTASDSSVPTVTAPPAAGSDDPHRVAKPSDPVEVPNLATRKRGDDWPRFLGPTGDSRSAETGLVVPWPAAGPRLVWQKRIGTSYAAPTISRGRLFLFERLDRSGEGQATLACLNAETGEPIWNFAYPTDYEDQYGYDNGPRCCPVVDGDRVYTLGAEGMLHCLRVTDGALIWRCNTGVEFQVVQNFFGVGAAPVVEGELLIVHVGGCRPESATGDFMHLKGNGSAVVAFDKLTGEVRYKISDELAGYASPTLATIDGRRWCFQFTRDGLLAFEPKSGQIDFFYPWRAPILESVNASNPLVVGNRVLISETYGPGASLLAVRPGDYDVVWADPVKSRAKILQTHWNTPVHHEGYVYASSGRHTNNAELRCIELATGKVMWSEPGLTRSSLLYVDGHLISLGEYGELLLLKANPQKFDVVSRVTLPAPEAGPAIPGLSEGQLLDYPCWAAPVLSHGLLYLRGANRVACLEVIPPE